MKILIVSVVISLVLGVLLGFANTKILQQTMQKSPNKLLKIFSLRLVLIAVLFIGLYFMAKCLQLDPFYTLLSGATGLVVVSIIGAWKVSRMQKKKEKEEVKENG